MTMQGVLTVKPDYDTGQQYIDYGNGNREPIVDAPAVPYFGYAPNPSDYGVVPPGRPDFKMEPYQSIFPPTEVRPPQPPYSSFINPGVLTTNKQGLLSRYPMGGNVVDDSPWKASMFPGVLSQTVEPV